MESGENEWVQNIQSQSGRLSRLISSLVTLCRLDEENPFPERTEFSLSDAVWEIAEPFSSLAAAKGKEYTQYIEDSITITGDRTAIGQLVSILLDNVIKYSADCGEMCIRDSMQVPGYTVIRHGCSRLRVSGRETEKLWPRRRLCRSRRSRCRAAYRQCPHLSVFLPLRELIYKYRAGHDQHQRNRCNGKRFCCLVSMPLFTSGGCVCAAIWAAALIFPEFFSALWAKHDTASFYALLLHLFYNLSLPYSRNSGKTNPEKRFLPA